MEGETLTVRDFLFEKGGGSETYIRSYWNEMDMAIAKTIQIKLGERVAYLNQSPIKLSFPAEAPKGTTLVPLRFVGEALGKQVSWDGETRKVSLDSK